MGDMGRRLALALVGLGASLGAQDPPEVDRTWCRDEDPRNRCPGEMCACRDDAFEVTFDGDTDSVLEVDPFRAGERISTAVVFDTRTEGVQGWAYGVRHDSAFLALSMVTAEGTDIPPIRPPPELALVSMIQIEDCTEDPDPRCPLPVEGGGYVSAVVLSLVTAPELPVGRNRIAIAEYTLDADPGPQGTLIQITDRLKKRLSPPSFSVTFTAAGWARFPRRLVDGWVKTAGAAPGVPFHRGDADGDGAIAVSDALRILLHLHAGGEPPGCLEAADFDDGGAVDLTDAVAVLEWLFRGGSDPRLPGPPRLPCNFDPPGSPSLGCEAYPGC
jgi:hypothetical protein